MATVKAAQEIHLSKAAGADFNIEVVRAQLPKCPKCDRVYAVAKTPVAVILANANFITASWRETQRFFLSRLSSPFSVRC
jgi:hypothetical protein